MGKYQEVKYYCSKCEKFHRKYAKKGVMSKTYKKHYEFKVDMDNYDLFKMDFKLKWRREAKKHADN